MVSKKIWLKSEDIEWHFINEIRNKEHNCYRCDKKFVSNAENEGWASLSQIDVVMGDVPFTTDYILKTKVFCPSCAKKIYKVITPVKARKVKP